MLWGAYNGLFLTLDRLFLREALARCGKPIATSVTLFIVMIGWAIFRSENTAHIGPFLAALFGKSQASDALEVPPEVPLALVIGALISLFPATRLYPWLVRQHEQHVWLENCHHRRAAADLSCWRWRAPLPCRSSPSSISGSDHEPFCPHPPPHAPHRRRVAPALLPLISAWNAADAEPGKSRSGRRSAASPTRSRWSFRGRRSATAVFFRRRWLMN